MGGGVDSEGNEVTMPSAAYHALTIDGIARRYHVLLSAVLEEDARVLHYVSIANELIKAEADNE